tara:strand:+ start:5499 stop:5975 length:477 start_codon:yes stop_codon:yes gene_type:complete
MQVISRHNLRNDSIREFKSSISSYFDVELPGSKYELVELSHPLIDIVLIDKNPLACYIDGFPSLTIKGANISPPSNKIVCVDKGAIKFVSNGADIMKPGITRADSSIESGDLVIVTEEVHGKALCVGRSLKPYESLLGNSGKAVESIHYVGDELYHFF